jgi:hypothetical protein
VPRCWAQVAALARNGADHEHDLGKAGWMTRSGLAGRGSAGSHLVLDVDGDRPAGVEQLTGPRPAPGSQLTAMRRSSHWTIATAARRRRVARAGRRVAIVDLVEVALARIAVTAARARRSPRQQPCVFMLTLHAPAGHQTAGRDVVATADLFITRYLHLPLGTLN